MNRKERYLIDLPHARERLSVYLVTYLTKLSFIITARMEEKNICKLFYCNGIFCLFSGF